MLCALGLWYKVMKFPNLSPGTRELSESIIERHIKPGIGQVTLNNLDIIAVRSFYNKLLEEGNLRKPGTGLSPASLKQVHNIVRQTLEWAFEEGWLASDFYRKLKVKQARTLERKVMSTADAIKFYRACKEHHLGQAFRLALLYGLRRGEVLGLKWDKVFQKKGEVHIHRTLSQGKNGLRLGPTKTDGSKRELPTFDAVDHVLNNARSEVQVWRDGKGKQFNAEDYVFFSIKGNPVDPRGFVRQFHTLLKQLDIPRIAFHDLRHSTSSILELLGVPLRTRMAILGHSDYRTGLKYTHVMPGTLKKDLEKIGKLLTRMDDETIDVDEFIENCRKTVVNGGV